MPMTPADTKTTIQDEIAERAGDAVDTLTAYARRWPYAAAALGLAVGLFTVRSLIRRI